MQNIPFMDIAWYFGDDMDCWLCGLILLRNKGATMATNIYKAFFIIALLANLTNASIFVESIGLGESVEAAKKRRYKQWHTRSSRRICPHKANPRK
mgnify:CR=1 FL=1